MFYAYVYTHLYILIMYLSLCFTYPLSRVMLVYLCRAMLCISLDIFTEKKKMRL